MQVSDSPNVSGRACELARTLRCTEIELQAGIAELQRTGTADVRFHNGVITLECRRLKRAHKERQDNYLRQALYRHNEDITAKNKGDPRFRRVLDIIFKKYLACTGRGISPLLDKSDFQALVRLLKKAPDISEEELGDLFENFLKTKDDFHRKFIGIHPLRYFATRIHAFQLKSGKDRESELEEIEKRMKKK